MLWLCVDRSIKIEERTFEKHDIETQDDLVKFAKLIEDIMSQYAECGQLVFDVTGGRKVMSIVLALEAKKCNKPVYIAFIPARKSEYVKSRVEVLKQYLIDDLLKDLEKGTSTENLHRKYPWLSRVKSILCDELICREATILHI